MIKKELRPASYRKGTLEDYLCDLAAKKPAPGGGSAAALTGALGCALLSMVCNYTIGKDKYKDVEAEIKEILKETERLRKRLLFLVDLDIKAYYKVSNSRKGPGRIYQKNLIKATSVSLEICELSARACKFYPALIRKSNKYLISDVHVAKEFLKSSFKSAKLNVIINLPQIKDNKFISRAKKTIASLEKKL